MHKKFKLRLNSLISIFTCLFCISSAFTSAAQEAIVVTAPAIPPADCQWVMPDMGAGTGAFVWQCYNSDGTTYIGDETSSGGYGGGGSPAVSLGLRRTSPELGTFAAAISAGGEFCRPSAESCSAWVTRMTTTVCSKWVPYLQSACNTDVAEENAVNSCSNTKPC